MINVALVVIGEELHTLQSFEAIGYFFETKKNIKKKITIFTEKQWAVKYSHLFSNATYHIVALENNHINVINKAKNKLDLLIDLKYNNDLPFDVLVNLSHTKSSFYLSTKLIADKKFGAISSENESFQIHSTWINYFFSINLKNLISPYSNTLVKKNALAECLTPYFNKANIKLFETNKITKEQANITNRDEITLAFALENMSSHFWSEIINFINSKMDYKKLNIIHNNSSAIHHKALDHSLESVKFISTEETENIITALIRSQLCISSINEVNHLASLTETSCIELHQDKLNNFSMNTRSVQIYSSNQTTIQHDLVIMLINYLATQNTNLLAEINNIATQNYCELYHFQSNIYKPIAGAANDSIATLFQDFYLIFWEYYFFENNLKTKKFKIPNRQLDLLFKIQEDIFLILELSKFIKTYSIHYLHSKMDLMDQKLYKEKINEISSSIEQICNRSQFLSPIYQFCLSGLSKYPSMNLKEVAEIQIIYADELQTFYQVLEEFLSHNDQAQRNLKEI